MPDDYKALVERLNLMADPAAGEAADAIETLMADVDSLRINGDAVSEMRAASRQVLGGNCTWVDEDAAVLAAFANWAIENGAPRDICPAIFDSAMTAREHRDTAERYKAALVSCLTVFDMEDEDGPILKQVETIIRQALQDKDNDTD